MKTSRTISVRLTSFAGPSCRAGVIRLSVQLDGLIGHPRSALTLTSEAILETLESSSLRRLSGRRNLKGIRSISVCPALVFLFIRSKISILGGKYTPEEIIAKFSLNDADPHFQYPYNHLLKIQEPVSAADLSTPYLHDEQNNPCFIVAKVGQTTDRTFGRFSHLESYRCDELGSKESWEAAIFNFDKRSGNFSNKGDSGSLIFNMEGKTVAFRHSGRPRSFSNHITYATPAHFVIDQLRAHYPYADFSRTT